jgi:hypothetical protein
MPVDFTDFDRIVTKDRPPLGAGAVSGSPSDNSGNPTVSVDFSQVSGAPDLQAIEALTGTGIAVRTATDTWALRTLTAPAAGLTITNPAGVAGNPTFGLANDLSAIEALSGTGYTKRTGTDAWSLSATVPWSDIGSTPTTLSGYGIVDAQPLDGDLSALAALTGTNTIYYRSALSTWSAVTIGSGLSFSGGALTASGGGGSPGGSNTQLQFNDSGSFGGDADLTWDKTSNVLTVTGNITATSFTGALAWSLITSTPTTLAGYGIVDAQPLDGDLSAIAALTGTGLLQRTGTNTWSLTSAGTGDFVGPSSATDNALLRFDGTTGKLGQDSSTTLSDNGEMVITGASGGTRIPLVVASNASVENGIELRNLGSSGSKKSQIDWYANSLFQWALGNDTGANGTDDFFIYQGSLSQFSFRIKSDGKLRLASYGTGTLVSDSSGNITAVSAGSITGSTGSVDNRLIRADGTGGTTIQDSTSTLDDSGNLFVASVLATSGTTPVSGTTGTTLWASGGDAYTTWVQSGASTNQKIWDLIVSAATWSLRTVADNYFSASTILSFDRSGAISLPQVPLTTGLLINVATKSFPMTINGTTVSVLCA